MQSFCLFETAIGSCALVWQGETIIAAQLPEHDEATARSPLARRFPEAWRRIEGRRAFMTETLGIRLKPEVLPLSNMPGWLPPFWLNPRLAAAMR